MAKTFNEGTLGRAYSCPVLLVSENRKQNTGVAVEEHQKLGSLDSAEARGALRQW